MNESAPPSGKRFRFSLGTLLFMTAILALAVTVWQLYGELVPLRAEVRRLRDEVGELSMDDKAKLYAIRVRAGEDFTWKWRVWVPEGRAYEIRYAGDQIPKQGFPRATGMISFNQPGEHWIEYRISRHARSGDMMGELTANVGSVGGGEQKWVSDSWVSTGDGVGTTTEEFDPGQPVVLTRNRISTTVNDSSKIEDPSRGFMIWLAPAQGSGTGVWSRSTN
jgi:hypothetical protein